jgi:hypothetical protein
MCHGGCRGVPGRISRKMPEVHGQNDEFLLVQMGIYQSISKDYQTSRLAVI